ncbi:MAG: DUF1573 domain-containing protein [Ferruginibacter sp.]
MKKLLFSLTALALSTVLVAQTKSDDIAKFKTDVIDQGKLEINKPELATFVVTNIGTNPLIIEQSNPTCGCTVGDYTKEPIAPGKTGTITAKFNAASLGVFEKHLTVKFAGVDEMKSITIKGEVLSTDDYAKLKAGNNNTEVKNMAAAPSPMPATKTAVVKKKAIKKTVKAKTKTAVIASTNH